MKKHTKRILCMLLACSCVSFLAACTAQEAELEQETTQAQSEETDDTETLQISVILNTVSSEYWGYVAAGAKAYEVDYPNVKVTTAGPPSETAYDEQMNMIETALDVGIYDGIVISPLQADSVVTQIANTTIPVIAMNTPIESDKVISYVGTGNEAAAKQGGEAAVQAAKDAGWEMITAIAIGGNQGDPAGEERLRGFQTGLAEAGATVFTDEVQYAEWTADKAVSVMEAIMQTHPEGVSIIVACNDDMAMGAARAAKGNSAYENTIFCGFDGIQSACEAILNGKETLSVAQDPYRMGYLAVDTCVKAINGETLEAFIDTGCSIVDASNAQERLDLLKSYGN